MAERFFASSEWELIQESDWHSHAETRRAVFDSIEAWYHRERPHSSLDDRAPVENEDRLLLTPRRAA